MARARLSDRRSSIRRRPFPLKVPLGDRLLVSIATGSWCIANSGRGVLRSSMGRSMRMTRDPPEAPSA